MNLVLLTSYQVLQDHLRPLLDSPAREHQVRFEPGTDWLGDDASFSQPPGFSQLHFSGCLGKVTVVLRLPRCTLVFDRLISPTSSETRMMMVNVFDGSNKLASLMTILSLLNKQRSCNLGDRAMRALAPNQWVLRSDANEACQKTLHERIVAPNLSTIRAVGTENSHFSGINEVGQDK